MDLKEISNSSSKIGDPTTGTGSKINTSIIVCLILSVLFLVLIFMCWKGFLTDPKKKPPPPPDDVFLSKPTELTIKYCENGVCI